MNCGHSAEAGQAESALPTLAGAEWLTRSETQRVFAALNREGEEARAVGGAVRNALMGLPVTDVDLATTATPEVVIRLAENAGLRTVPTGFEHGTVTIIVDHHPFEVTTLRKDVETFGRHAAVAFTRDWKEDAQRRDFTINALYAAADGTVHDPLGGYADLVARRIRFIGEPVERIREDYLRILRFFRFNAEYGAGPLDQEGLRACEREHGGLDGLSAERVRVELLRLLSAAGAVRALEAMYDTGILVNVLGLVPRLAPLWRLTRIEAGLGLAADPLIRLAVLAVAVEEDAERLWRRLRLSNAEHKELAVMAAQNPCLSPSGGVKLAKVALYRLGSRLFRARLLYRWSCSGAEPDDVGWRALFELSGNWTPPRFPLKGADLIAMGLPAGPAVGEILRELENRWIEAGFTGDRECLLASAREAVAAFRGSQGRFER